MSVVLDLELDSKRRIDGHKIRWITDMEKDFNRTRVKLKG